jgi:hypothetical protein
LAYVSHRRSRLDAETPAVTTPKEAEMHDSVQELFRSVNDRIRDLQRDWPDEERTVMCECRDLACQATLPVTDGEYRSIAAAPGHFLVLPGHEQPEHERVVDGTSRYFVVAARGSALAEAPAPAEAALASAA